MKKKVYDRYIAMLFLAICFFSGCSQEKEESRAAYRKTGIECMEQGDYAGAVTAFETALKQKISDVDANAMDICYYKAAAQYANGDIDGAMATYQAIIDYDKKEANAYYLRGCLYAKRGEFEAAKSDFTNAVKYNANDYELYLNIYENLSGVGLAEDGKEYLKQAFSINGSAVTDLEYRGRIYYLLEEYSNAQTELAAAVEKGSVQAKFYLARTCEAMGDSETAETYYEEYIAAGNEDAAALNAMGEIMLEKGLYADAITYLEQGLNCEDASNTRALMQNLIVAYEYHGDFDKAWTLIQEYVGLYPEDEKAGQEYIFLKNRQIKEAP